MRAWQLFDPESPDGPTDLRLVELPDPVAGPCEVVVSLKAVSLNSRDLAVANGSYRGGRISYPLVPVSDGAGVVAAVGEGVTSLGIGDPVIPAFFPRWIDGPPSADGFSEAYGDGRTGMLAEKIVVPAASLVRVPEGLSFAEAACLPCAGVTAWNAIDARRQIGPASTVLVLGTGGVSIFALQLARARGARVVATSSSDEKLERLREMGAMATINYAREPDWDAAVIEVTGGRGVDLVVEVGGPGTLERSIGALAIGGEIALIGVLAGPKDINPLKIWRKSAVLRGIFVGSRAMLAELGAFMASEAISPMIDSEFPFEDAPAAYRRLAGGGHFGKVCIGF